MQFDNCNPDPFMAFQALSDIDRVVKNFVEESKEGELSKQTTDFLHELREFCRKIYYKEPDEIEKAKRKFKKEEANGP
ncbi:hypothetical protein CL634_04995 [bacterium]|nr:hypothetical protein [bacterium]|tara:strand:- start:546 stop:779 length:234 start_codon:yes stop_codon:yes gene_type:complete